MGKEGRERKREYLRIYRIGSTGRRVYKLKLTRRKLSRV